MSPEPRPGRDGRPVGRVLGHLRELFRLAMPAIASRFGVMAMALADTVMTGGHNGTELAFLGLGLAVVGVITLTALGLLMGTMVETAHALGGGRPRDCGAAWRRSVPFALTLGLAAAAICVFGEGILRLTGQDEGIAREGGRVIRAFGYGLPAYLLYVACNMFLEGLKRPLPGMVLMLLANILNVGFNWVLINGRLGAPELGAEGAALATSAVRVFLGVAAVAHVWWLADREALGIRAPAPGGWRDWAGQRRIGYAAGLSLFIEASCFAFVNLMSGWLGATAAAGFAITHNLLALCFMVAVGIGSATAVRVGHAHGRHDPDDAALAGWLGLAANSAIMVVVGAALSLNAGAVARLYADADGVVAVATGAIALLLWISVVDGGQGVMANALRGRGDAWIPTGLHTVSYVAVMVPAAWGLAFPLGRGVTGLFEGILVASVVSFAVLSTRFLHLSRRDRRLRAAPSPGRT